MQKTILSIILFVLLTGCSDKTNQNVENPVQDSVFAKSKLSAAYSTFIKGYESLDAEVISHSYTEDAILINVYNDSEPISFKGRKNIYSFFSENLEQAKSQNLSLKITFKISGRQIVDQTILDNGYYKLEISSPDQDIKERFGKFSIVLIQELDEWKFSVDTNASSTKAEYQGAQSI